MSSRHTLCRLVRWKLTRLRAIPKRPEEIVHLNEAILRALLLLHKVADQRVRIVCIVSISLNLADGKTYSRRRRYRGPWIARLILGSEVWRGALGGTSRRRSISQIQSKAPKVWHHQIDSLSLE